MNLFERPLNIQMTDCGVDRLFTLDPESDLLVRRAHQLLAKVGRTDILLHGFCPEKILLGDVVTRGEEKKCLKEIVLPRIETIANSLTGMPRDLLEMFDGVRVINRWPKLKIIWVWEEIKKASLQNG